jgi:hypothetical protein
VGEKDVTRVSVVGEGPVPSAVVTVPTTDILPQVPVDLVGVSNIKHRRKLKIDPDESLRAELMMVPRAQRVPSVATRYLVSERVGWLDPGK